jgi:hypothetical protein
MRGGAKRDCLTDSRPDRSPIHRWRRRRRRRRRRRSPEDLEQLHSPCTLV